MHSFNSINMKSDLAIIIGTGIQEKICRKILPALNDSLLIKSPTVVSLDRLYRFGLYHGDFKPLILIKDIVSKPWYERSRTLKLFSLIFYVWQIFYLSLKIKHFVFFVDTGVLERSAIFILRKLRCKVAILQDATKREPRFGSKRSLTWFGGGGADLYLLLGERYESMIQGDRATRIVGSPIYYNRISPLPPGENILVINQCFAKYGEVGPDTEFEFIAKVVQEAVQYGPVELRLHPHNDLKRYQILTSYNIKITQKQSLGQSLCDAGIVLCINSTVILEALAVGRTVLILDWHPSPFKQPVDDGVILCEDQAAMCAALEKWKSEPHNLVVSSDRSQSIIKSFISFEGRESTRRIAAALESFVIK